MNGGSGQNSVKFFACLRVAASAKAGLKKFTPACRNACLHEVPRLRDEGRHFGVQARNRLTLNETGFVAVTLTKTPGVFFSPQAGFEGALSVRVDSDRAWGIRLHHMSFIKFLGTAGARFVVMKQLRASGGAWLSVGKTNLYIDPGPGALVRCLHSKPKLEPSLLDGILLTHKHLDHSGDINIMIEAMTEGGFKKRGILFAPADALEEDPVVLKYVMGYVERVEVLKEDAEYRIGDIPFSTARKHQHRVETYGINFKISPHTVSWMTDTKFFPELPNLYPGEILIIHVVRLKPIGDEPIDHLSIEDVKMILKKANPKLAILTHFGMTMIKAKPWVVAAELEKELGLKVIAASDGMKLDLERDLKN